MTIPNVPLRYRAISMELAAYLDGRYVEMHILTDTGAIIPRDSIFAVQRNIERIGRECPEIATWSRGNQTDAPLLEGPLGSTAAV